MPHPFRLAALLALGALPAIPAGAQQAGGLRPVPITQPAAVRMVLIKRADAPDTILPDLVTPQACQATIDALYALDKDLPYTGAMCIDPISGNIIRYASGF